MSELNDDQARYWTDDAGPKWVAQEAALDTHLQPVLDRVLTLADLQAGFRVLDIGCGTGQSTLAAAQHVGMSGHVVGADISDTMLIRARDRAGDVSQASFLCADVADHRFDAASFDRIISRFGVMFFADPDAAFANIATALRSGGRLAFASWGAISDNPYFTLPAQAAKARLGAPPKPDPDAPGPFAFRDIARVEAILSRAGFVRIEARAEKLLLTPKGSITDVADFTTHIGPAAGTLRHFEGDEADRLAIRDGIEALFAPFQTSRGIEIPGEINFFTASRA